MRMLFANIDEIIDGTPEEKPMTNADRIRAMSDEELAAWFDVDGWGCEVCDEHRRISDTPFWATGSCDQKCEEHCLEWLQQPAEEVNKDA